MVTASGQPRCTVLGVDRAADIAVLETDATDVQFHSDGNPEGMDQNSMCMGTTPDGKFVSNYGAMGIVESICTSCPILSGNSGGPIVDVHGRVLPTGLLHPSFLVV